MAYQTKACLICGEKYSPNSSTQMYCSPCAIKARPEKLRENLVKWRLANPEKIREYGTNWIKANREKRQIARRKGKAKRRTLGFHSLNSWFAGCAGHHINESDVIYIPRELHKSVYHDLRTGRGMAEINALAGAFFTEDWT